MLMVAPSWRARPCARTTPTRLLPPAGDTRDADGDGIYCETLPCPCLKPGSGSTPPAPTAPPPPPPPPPPEATSCGVERRAVKTLTDNGASRVSFVAKPTTIGALRLLLAPDVGRNSPRLAGEFSTYRLKVRLRSMKIEDDSDIHAIAEFEHALMSERTRDGLDAARARGRTGGQKPKLTARQAKIAQDMYDELGSDGRRAHTVQQIADEFGVTRPTIYRHLQRPGA